MGRSDDVLIATNGTALMWMRVFGRLMPDGPHPVVTSASEIERLVARACRRAEAVDSIFDRSCSSYGERIELLVSPAIGRRHIKGVRTHVAPLPLPGGSIWKSMTEGYYVVSPELLFGLMSRDNDSVALALLGYELCGTYCLDSRGGREVLRRDPLTTPQEIGRVLSECGLFGDRSTARRALRHVIAGSASPMESRAAFISVLPRSLGGFGMPEPALNGRVELTLDEQRRLGKSCLYCDLLWGDLGVAMEYDSSTFHGTGKELSQTLDRRSVLEEKGIHVLSLTYADMTDPDALARKAEALAKTGGLRMRPYSEKALAKMAAVLARLNEIDWV